MKTKIDAIYDFRTNELYGIKKIEEKHHNGKVDHFLRSEQWNYYTHCLYKDKEITLKQYETWTNPFSKGK